MTMPETYIDDDGHEVLLLVDGLPFGSDDVDGGTRTEINAIAEMARRTRGKAMRADMTQTMREMLTRAVRRARAGHRTEPPPP